MKADNLKLGFAYLRLSNDEAKKGESESIKNQRSIIQSYCDRNGITLVREFVDDGWSGGNFNRPGFQEMIRQLEQGRANIVITKDLSRLGRDMFQASYFAERYFPENGIQYLAIGDNIDSKKSNKLMPFQLAMNEQFLRDVSDKVKFVLNNKRENGLYCACPPYGYRKEDGDKNKLVPDEMTAPVVQRIFQQAAQGDSSRKIAQALNDGKVIPPLKYRALHRDKFSPKGTARVSDLWNDTTVKRILKNEVYLGHTLLGRSQKVSVKSNKKETLPAEEWAVTRNTHQPLVTQELFDRAQHNLGKAAKDYRAYDHVRKSIFSGITVCARCGHALCSAGSVYNGEREKYWYLSCTHQRKGFADRCEGVRIRYADLLELVRQELNYFLSLSEEEEQELVREVVRRSGSEENRKFREMQREKAQKRLAVIEKTILKLYTDNAEGKLSDERLSGMMSELEQEATGLNEALVELDASDRTEDTEERFARFFALTRQYTHLETLDRETLLTFVEKIEIGPKELPEGVEKATRRNQPYRQSVRIFYKFIGDLSEEPMQDFPKAAGDE